MCAERKCRICGCTNAKACITNGVPCHWIKDDLCSNCKKVKIIIDENTCVGCGLCAAHCPELFELGDNGLSKVKEDKEYINVKVKLEAAGGCPVGAITIE